MAAVLLRVAALVWMIMSGSMRNKSVYLSLNGDMFTAALCKFILPLYRLHCCGRGLKVAPEWIASLIRRLRATSNQSMFNDEFSCNL